MSKLEEIKHTLERLSLDELEYVAGWIEERSIIPPGRYQVSEAFPAYAPTQPRFMTLQEYLELEERSQIRHEYINGDVYAMNGPSLAHSRITRRLLNAFETHLHGKPCEPFAMNCKLQIDPDTDGIFYYPDLMVACNPDEWGSNFVCNPKLVIEVLSPSTRRIDLREKAMTYRSVASIEEYALLEQDKHELTLYRRAEGWKPHVYGGPQAVAEFRSIALSVPLSKIYAGTLPAE